MHTEEIVFEDNSAGRQIRRQLEAGRGGALIVACSDHAGPIDAICRAAGADGALVLRVLGADLRRPGVWEAITLAATSTTLRSVTLLGHSGCHHALEHCPDLPILNGRGSDADVMGRLSRGVHQHGRMIEAARRTVRAGIRALSTMEALKPGPGRSTPTLHGALLIVDSGVWQHYRREGDAFVADVDSLAA